MPGYFFHIAIERLSPAISLSPHIDIFESELTNHISKASANHRGDASAQSAALGHRDHTPTTHAELPKSVFGVQGRATLRPTLPNQNTPRNDRRIDNISIRGFDMEPSPKAATSRSDMTAQTPTQTHHADQSAGLLAKGIFIPSPVKDTDVGLGIVHLYRDGQETPGLYDVVPGSKEGIADADCRILCILAVPSYMTPSDFLGFVGEQTKGDVSHFRLVKTERANRYMVLMKFRESQKAREWWKEWNGKRFNNMEPEYCQIVFVKSVKIHTGTSPGDRSSYSAFENDPFTPAPFTKPTTSLPANGSQVSKAPEFPTSNSSLVEVPTCTICLDRMDESSGGVLIIPCQHAYHCDCYQQWRKSGCPVCRYTENDLSSQNAPEGPEGKCNDCNTDKDLWVCTICGNVGCGRSDPTKAHSMNHWKENPAHRFAMSLSNQSIWDYEDDKFVDRLLLKEDKFVDHPASSRPPFAVAAYGGDSVLLQQARLEIAHEYTVRLSEQLAETRRHWEEKVESTKHAAKMAKEKVTRELKERSREAKDLRTKYENLRAENKEMVKQYNAKIQQAQLNSEEKLRQSRMQSEKKTKQLEKQNSSLAQELETFKLLCEESQRKSERLLQELEEYKASSASLQEQAAAEASRELKASNEKVETVEKEKNELKKEVEKLRRDAALSATQAVASTKDYIKELKQKLREAETKAKEESAFSSQITENLKLMRREKQAAEEQRDGAVNRVKGMEKELQGKDAAIRGKETERLKAIQLAESYQQELQEAYMNLAKAMEVNSSMVEGTLKPEDAKGASLSVGQGSAAPQSPPTPVLQPAEPVQQKKETRAERRAREREEKKKAGGN